MLATMAGEPRRNSLWCSAAVDLLDQTAALAPDEADDAIGLVADAYAGFEALLFEIDFVVSDLPVDDPRPRAERCRIRRGDRDHHGGVYVSDPLDLTGRTAIVTGGTKGLGRVIATTFSSMAPR